MASYPECTICKKPFKWKGPDPYLLPCLHSVCESCLRSAEGRLYCSSCHREVNLKNTTLQKDLVRQRRILHLTAKHRPTELLCTHDDDGNQAVCWCQECEEFLCEHCQNMHESFKANKGHTICGIGEIGTSEDEEETYCKSHKKYVLELFDLDCGVLICLKCTQGDHAGHSTEDINTVAESSRDELQKNYEVMNDLKMKAQHLLGENTKQAEQLKEDETTQREKIHHTFDTLRAVVDQREKEITSSLGTHMDQTNLVMLGRKSQLTLHHNISSIISEYTQMVLDHGTKSVLHGIAGVIKDTVKQHLSTDSNREVKRPSAIAFQAEGLQEVKSTLSTFSVLWDGDRRLTKNTCNSQLVPYDVLLQRCEAQELEVSTLRQTIASLEVAYKLEKEMSFGAEAASPLYSGSGVLNVSTAIPSTFEGLMDEVSALQYVQLMFNPRGVNTKIAQINTNGELCNQPDTEHGQEMEKVHFMDAGASSTEPLSQADHLQYWESRIAVTLDQMISLFEHILEIGVCCELEKDKSLSYFIRMQPHSYCLSIGRCMKHTNSICRQVWKEGKHVRCLPDALPNKQNIPTTLHYGVVFDYSRRRLAFIDVKEATVISVLNDVDTRNPLWPMFGVCRRSRGSVNIKLLEWTDVKITEEKKMLILNALY